MADVSDVLTDAEAAARELAVYLSHDADRASSRHDTEAAAALRDRWRTAGDLAEQLRTLNPASVVAEPRALTEVRALVAQLSYRLAGLVPDIAERRRRVVVGLSAADARVEPVDQVVGYVRVSTARQAAAYGPDVQEATIREWARSQRARVVAIVRDDGVSGAILDRPGLADALGYVEGGRAGAIVVARLDRLARDQVLQEWLRAEVIAAGGQLRSAEPEEDRLLIAPPDDPTATMVRQILGAVAQHERAMIRLRMAAGKAKKRQAGGYVGGQPPYGYRAADHDLVPNLEEQRQTARMRRWRRDGKSYREIADRLNAENVPARRGRWHPQTVARVLDRAGARKAS